MTVMTAPHYLLELTEAQWQALVLEAAALNGWLVYHTKNSKGSHKGFPDLVLIRPGFLFFLELKTEKGPVKVEQVQWIELLQTIYGPIKAMIARPSDWDEISRILDNPWGTGQLPLGANP